MYQNPSGPSLIPVLMLISYAEFVACSTFKTKMYNLLSTTYLFERTILSPFMARMNICRHARNRPKHKLSIVSSVDSQRPSRRPRSYPSSCLYSFLRDTSSTRVVLSIAIQQDRKVFLFSANQSTQVCFRNMLCAYSVTANILWVLHTATLSPRSIADSLPVEICEGRSLLVWNS